VSLEEEDSEKIVHRSTHLFLILLVLTMVLFILWIFIGRLGVSSKAEGVVFPSTKMKSIQHLEGGIVQSIHVKEGDLVQAGQVLLRLETVANASEIAELKTLILSTKIDILRFQAELKIQDKLIFPKVYVSKNKTLTIQAQQLFLSRMRTLSGNINLQKKQIQQTQHAMTEVKARMKNSALSLKLIKEKIAISKDLLKDDLTNRFSHIDLLREKNSINSKLEEDTAVLKKSAALLLEKRLDLEKVHNEFKEDVRKKLEAANRTLQNLNEKIARFSDALRRTEIRAPVNGVIKQLYVVTKGGVVKPGETVLDIIPSGDQLVIEAKLPVDDVGYITVGQSATIKLSSVSGLRYDNLMGKVVQISPDSIQPPEGAPYYSVRIETSKNYFEDGNLRYKLYPGVQVRVNIQTGKRSLFSYLIGPLFRSFDEALQEK
jgi:adhesin transport system membrane fusion protein